MAYGGPSSPWGLQAVKTVTGASWNGQTSPYFINPAGYAISIFKGDPVYLGADGYIHSLGELGNINATGVAPILGVFNGCSYQTSTATNPIDPASPGRTYYPANTVSFNNTPITCDIIDDPNVIFNVQSDGTALGQSACGICAPLNVQGQGGTTGNTTTGISGATINGAGIAVGATLNVRLLRLVNTPGNVPAPGGTLANINFEVLIQNHQFMQRAVGL